MRKEALTWLLKNWAEREDLTYQTYYLTPAWPDWKS